jgi:hypothetical protein
VRNLQIFVGFAALVVASSAAVPVAAAEEEREALLIEIAKKVRKGIDLRVPTLTKVEDAEGAVPSNMRSVRAALRKCVDTNPFVADLLDAEQGFVETAINLSCDGAGAYGAIAKFTLSGELTQVTFYPGGILFAPPPPLDFDPSKKAPE